MCIRDSNGTPFLPDLLLERYLTGLPLKEFPCDVAVSLCDAMRRLVGWEEILSLIHIWAFSLYMSSAEQGNPYASLELAKMYRDGLGTEPDLQQAEWRFQNAYSGFVVLEEKSHDDKLQYRIGQMLQDVYKRQGLHEIRGVSPFPNNSSGDL